jgi:hypothetical protein
LLFEVLGVAVVELELELELDDELILGVSTTGLFSSTILVTFFFSLVPSTIFMVLDVPLAVISLTSLSVITSLLTGKRNKLILLILNVVSVLSVSST